jgi:hypothetical protein
MKEVKMMKTTNELIGEMLGSERPGNFKPHRDKRQTRETQVNPARLWQTHNVVSTTASFASPSILHIKDG